MGAKKLANNRRNGADENSGKWENEDQGLQMRGEKGAMLSPVSEAPDEDEDDGLYMYDIRDAGVPAVPDGGYGWVIVIASFFCNLIVDGIAYTFGVFLPKFAEDFKVGKGEVAWAGSLLCGVYLCVGPIVSALANKYGCRSVCIAGSIVGSAGFALSSLSPDLGVLMITYGVIGGIGFGLIYLPAVVCVGYYFESKRALATGIAVCGSGVGTFVFAPFASALLTIMDWRGANLVFSGLILSCGLFGMLMKPLEVQVQLLDEEDEDEEDDEEGNDVERSGSKKKPKPLLQRMADDKKHYMERGSLSGSAYFMVQLPDGTMERRMKRPLNVDPGVHSSFNLDQLVPGTPITPVPTMPILPTITEAKTTDTGSTVGSEGSRDGSVDPEKKGKDESGNGATEGDNVPFPNIPEPIEEEKESEEEKSEVSGVAIPKISPRERRNSDGVQSTSPSSNVATPVSSVKQDAAAFLSKSPSMTKPTMPPRVGSTLGTGLKHVSTSIPRNGSAPQFNYARSIPKNTSVPFFDKQQTSKKPTFRAVPLGTAPAKGSKANLQALQQESRRGSITNTIKGSIASFMGSKIINTSAQDDDANSLWSKQELSDGLIFSSSQKSSAEPRHIIRPMSRKDIFYSGSIVNLPEYRSQMSINSYRQSVLNLPQSASGTALDGYQSPDKVEDGKPPPCCPCLGRSAGAFKSALAQLMDFSLLANPVFLFIAVSNVFGMAGFYVPFVYLIDAAVLQGVDQDKAALLLSIIGVTNTLGRVLSGMISDLPQVNSLFMNNVCILLSGICVLIVPFCQSSYYAYVGVAVFFGLFVSAYISLTSIILVDLLGLENLTNAFGLLILFRGFAGIIGAPLAGAVFDNFKSYDVSFYLAGGFLIIAAVISFLVPIVTRCAPEKPVLQPPNRGGTFLEDIPEGAESNSNSEDVETDSKYDHVESSL